MMAEIIKTEQVLGNTLNVYGTFKNPLFLAKDVANWIGHTHTTTMVESLDYDEKLNVTVVHAGQRREVLMVTEDGLYEIFMLSRKPIAKAFKKEVKRILKELRTKGVVSNLTRLDIAKMLVESEEEKLILVEKIEEDKPKVIFAESISNTNGGILIGDFAKKLCNEGFNIGQNRLFRWLREHNFLFTRGANANQPYQKWIDRGFFVISTSVIGVENNQFSRDTTRITGAGQIYVTNKLQESEEFILEPKLF